MRKGQPVSGDPFWKTKTLAQMTREEWESLCDGCAKCCLLKLQDEDDDSAEPETAYTDVACRLLDRDKCHCTDYEHRARRVPDCIVLKPDNLDKVAKWLPGTCAYRRLWEGRDLAWWHPLICGETETLHHIGVSLRGRMVCERAVPNADLEDHIVPEALISAEPDNESD